MKKVILILITLMLFSCKKDKDLAPTPISEPVIIEWIYQSGNFFKIKVKQSEIPISNASVYITVTGIGIDTLSYVIDSSFYYGNSFICSSGPTYKLDVLIGGTNYHEEKTY